MVVKEIGKDGEGGVGWTMNPASDHWATSPIFHYYQGSGYSTEEPYLSIPTIPTSLSRAWLLESALAFGQTCPVLFQL